MLRRREQFGRRTTLHKPRHCARSSPSTPPNARGFTLLELMIVISIIMILMAVAVPLYNQHRHPGPRVRPSLESEHACAASSRNTRSTSKSAAVARRSCASRATSAKFPSIP